MRKSLLYKKWYTYLKLYLADDLPSFSAEAAGAGVFVRVGTGIVATGGTGGMAGGGGAGVGGGDLLGGVQRADFCVAIMTAVAEGVGRDGDVEADAAGDRGVGVVAAGSRTGEGGASVSLITGSSGGVSTGALRSTCGDVGADSGGGDDGDETPTRFKCLLGES